MNKIFRHIIWIILIPTFVACATAPDGYERKRNSTTQLKKDNKEIESSAQFITKPIAGEPGMIYIERKTKEYSISMVLDASD